MTDYIQDGTGAGYRAKVDSKNRLKAFATTETGGTEASLDGELYNINTGTISLTTDSTSALLYAKNEDSAPWIIDRVFYNAGNSTGGSGDFLAEVVANPSKGTVVSAGTDLPPYNLNFGSSKTLLGTIKKGAEGSTVTDGEVRVSTIVPSSGTRVLISFDSIVLEPGSSIAIEITPQSGNTLMSVQVGLNIYRFIQ